MPKIGARIHELRRRRGLNLRELALRSGVSHSSVSLIERDLMSPSVNTLTAILDALGSTLTGFFLDLKSDLPYTPFYSADELVEIGRRDGISYRMVGANYPNRHLLIVQETYAPGASSGDLVAHSAQEGGLVTQGCIEVTVGGEVRELTTGDGFYFDSQLPHRFQNKSSVPCQIVSAMSPPTF